MNYISYLNGIGGGETVITSAEGNGLYSGSPMHAKTDSRPIIFCINCLRLISELCSELTNLQPLIRQCIINWKNFNAAKYLLSW